MARREQIRVHPLPLPSVVELVNEWGDDPRRAAGTSDEHYPTSRTMAAGTGPVAQVLAQATDAALTQVANQIHAVFSAVGAAAVGSALTALVEAAALTPVFAEAEDTGVLEQQWFTDRSEHVLLAAAIVTLIERLRAEPDVERLGICGGDDCVDVWVDDSPGGRRRFCSVTCQNRARTRAYRAAHRGTPPAQGDAGGGQVGPRRKG